ncbi:MAG TPA: ATP-binding cassette domain-containing protein [Candidatus Saccharimonadales bacterium]|nr:ATP-binding cassette domain-containing protein [Candidatus Saccharimonadales bacterium]
MPSDPDLVVLKNATLQRDGRPVWRGLQASIRAGEFVAVLGPNGAGKTSLLKVLLGLLPLTSGSAYINGQAPERGNNQIGYIPQQKSFDPLLPIRGWDLVELGINGHKFGLGGKRQATKLVKQAIEAVGATDYASVPIGLLSGGEQQRLRIAQALVGEPSLLLCDEPLLSLDLASQSKITGLLNDYRQQNNAAVLFVTHEVNPILPYVDRILYLANGHWLIDTPQRVLQSRTLTKLYGSPVDVLRVHNRVLVVGADDEALTAAGVHHAHEQDIGDAH